MKQVTCNPYYTEVIRGLKDVIDVQNLDPDEDPEEMMRHVFSIGFIAGQCEKVHLGACEGAMFRASEIDHEALTKTVEYVANIYELTVELIVWKLNGQEQRRELWVCRRQNKLKLVRLSRLTY